MKEVETDGEFQEDEEIARRYQFGRVKNVGNRPCLAGVFIVGISKHSEEKV
jgi:hypothetical protein